jgi:NCS2 family nucleobase:cation symporter-2
MATEAVSAEQTDAVHPVDQMLPVGQLLAYGLQHVLAMYAGAVAVPLILASALKLSQPQLVYLINADLFSCGIATLIQTLGLGKIPVGSKLPIVQGCTFAAVTPMILIGSTHGLTTIYGSIIVAGLITFLLSPFYGRLVRFFPPVVTGSIITIIGISLLPVATGWITNSGLSAIPVNMLLALITLVIILCISRFFRGFIANIAILLGLIIGTLIMASFGLMNFSAVLSSGWIGVTTPFKYGWPRFDLVSIISLTLVMLVTMTETTGDMIAVSEIVEKPLDRQTLSAGLAADGLATIIGGFLNAFPYTAFAQNVGLVSVTRVRSRFVVATAGVMLVVLGLFPKLAALVASVPQPVLGGAGLVLFGMVAASGVRVLSKVEFHGNNNIYIVAVSIAIGLIPIGAPQFYALLPSWSQIILNSGITAGSVTAIVLNLLFGARAPESQYEPEPTEPPLASEGEMYS